MAPPRLIFPVGTVFRSLTVVSAPLSDKTHTCYDCRCICGQIVRVTAGNLKWDNTSSCGCQKPLLCRAGRLTHGGTGTKLYGVWNTMRQRCENPRSVRYIDYGARGITVCLAWTVFANFCAWALTNGYTVGLQIDRRDNDGPYSPDNCRWATPVQQRANRRDSRRVETPICPPAN